MKQYLTKIFALVQFVLTITFMILILQDDAELQIYGVDCWAVALLFEVINWRRFTHRKKFLDVKDKMLILFAEVAMLVMTFLLFFSLEIIPFWLAIVLILATVTLFGWQVMQLDAPHGKIYYILCQAARVITFISAFILILNIVLNYDILDTIGNIGIYLSMGLLIVPAMWNFFTPDKDPIKS